MLHLVRNNSPYTVIILFILTLVLKLQALGHPVMPVVAGYAAVFGLIVAALKHIFGENPTIFTLLAAVMIFGQSLYLSGIAGRHRIFAKTILGGFLTMAPSSPLARLC